MNRMRAAVTVVAMSLTLSSAATAQTCLGLPPIAIASMNLGVAGEFTRGIKGAGARFGVVGERAFAGASAGFADYSDADVSATMFGGDVGYSIPVKSASSLRLCPVVSLSFQDGPNFDDQPVIIQTSALVGTAGLAMGGSIDVSPVFALVPFARVGLLAIREKISDLHNTNTNETGGFVSGGLSFRLNSMFVVTPGVSIPVGFDDADPTFSIGVALGFRH
ncbi:MAG TPA: hypothetical protein VE869_18240 [Gemmatimonas sp.]|nr:hypothetical protein [Gemmatimonas sp.]